MQPRAEEDSEFGGDTQLVDIDSRPVPLPGPLGALKVDPIPKELRPRLEIANGPMQGNAILITKPIVILGRIAGVADIVIPDPKASRHHAAICHQAGRFTIYDLGSSNGTSVDGRKVAVGVLKANSELVIGQSKLIFRLD